MTQRNSNTKLMTFLLMLILTLVIGVAAAASEVHELANGIKVTIYGADEIRLNPAVCNINLAANQSNYVPFDNDEVLGALADMNGFSLDLDVTVYLLPAPAASINSSYARGNSIYLAPGTGTIAAATQAYITTHEMGHVLTASYMDNSSIRWDSYLQLRGLDLEMNGPSAPHADRAREIVAEDFRFLFGGSLATSTGSIENHYLDLPTEVDGLNDLMLGFLAEKAQATSTTASVTAYPNPCNPRTTIKMALPSGVNVGNSVRLSIFDVRGSLVRTIIGGRIAGDNVSVDWNGDNDQGQGVSSGRYLYVIQTNGVLAKGAVTLVR